MGDFVKKNGLLYSSDLHTVIGVDDTSNLFNGRIPFGAHSIDDEVFSDCPYESVSIPDSVTHLGNKLFENSKALEKVKLPVEIKELPPYLFSGCSALTKVTMPNVVNAFSEGLFMGCTSLSDIPFRAGITVLPENVFAGCTGVKSVVIPNTVTKICSGAFANCTSLESIVFPSCIAEIAPDAFEGCTSIHSIRIEGDSEGGLIYINEDDGCLYIADDDGDKIAVQVYGVNHQPVSFYKENVDDEPIEANEDDEEEEDDTFFSAEIGAGEEEFDTSDINKVEKLEEKKMDNSNVDSMLAEIMGDESKRNAIEENVSVSDAESAALTGAMDVMSDNSRVHDAYVSNDELANLFEKHEEEQKNVNKPSVNPDEIDCKTKILISSVKFSEVLEFQPEGDAEDPELFVIAEKIIKDAQGNDCFSSKLKSCCKSFANIHDFKRVILIYGLPFENDEFLDFYSHFISMKNVLFACEAEKPSTLSDYGKQVCELSRISLDKEELKTQRQAASTKTNMLIKLVIRDKYDN